MGYSITLRRIAIIAVFATGIFCASAQEVKPLQVSADIVSSYIWRGSVVTWSPNIQPTIAFKKNGLEIGFWGSTDFTGNYKEGDFWAAYTIGNIKFGITDYNWLFTKSYFNFKKEQTDHILEANISYTGKKIPINFSVNTAFWGADKAVDDSTKNAYSTYVEVGYTVGNVNIFTGFTPRDGMYGDGYGNVTGFAVVNIGLAATKEIKITDSFSVPVKATLGLNPQQEILYIAFGITL